MSRRSKARSQALVPVLPSQEVAGVSLTPFEKQRLAELVQTIDALPSVDGQVVVQDDEQQETATLALNAARRYVSDMEKCEPVTTARKALRDAQGAVKAWVDAHKDVLAGRIKSLNGGILKYREIQEERARAQAREAKAKREAELEAQRKRARGGNRERITQELTVSRAQPLTAVEEEAAAAAEVHGRGRGATQRRWHGAVTSVEDLVVAMVVSNPDLREMVQVALSCEPQFRPRRIPVDLVRPWGAKVNELARTFRDTLDVPGLKADYTETVGNT